MISGSCLCGGIRFEIDAVLALTHCHCSICRKVTGAAFGTWAHVRKKHFRLLSGEDLITTYESTPGSHRGFCRVCGSIAPGQASYLPTVSIAAGLIEGDPGIRRAQPSCVRFVEGAVVGNPGSASTTRKMDAGVRTEERAIIGDTLCS